MNLQFRKSPDEKGKGRLTIGSKTLLLTFIYGLDMYSLNWITQHIEKECLKRIK